MLRMTRSMILVSLVFLLAPIASAQCVPSLCSLTLTLRSDASGITLGGSGTNSAAMSFGTMQAFGGSVPSGVTKTIGATSWTLSTPFDVKVTCTNLLSLLPCTILMTPTYTLTAQLQSADATNTWKIGSFTLSSSSATTLTSSGAYGTATSYSFSLAIPFSEPAGTISNTINFVAISN